MEHKNLKAFILAAGFGTRLGALTKDTPKALIPFMNKPMLFHLLEQLEETGITDVCINAHYKWEALKKTLESYEGPLKIHLSIEKEILGTGGALAAVDRWRKRADLLVVNADIIHAFDLNQIIKDHYESKHLVTLALTEKPHAKETKIWCHENKVMSFGEQTTPDQTAHGFACIHVISSSLLNKFPKNKFFSIIPVYKKLIAKGLSVHAYISDKYWKDMGTPEQYLKSMFEFATRIKAQDFLKHPAFKEPQKSLEAYEKTIEELKEFHPQFFEEQEV